jgi:hypothetical protein
MLSLVDSSGSLNAKTLDVQFETPLRQVNAGEKPKLKTVPAPKSLAEFAELFSYSVRGSAPQKALGLVGA